MSTSSCPFTEKDFESKDGMLTNVWGPPLWHSLHMMSFNYPMKPTKAQKNQYLEFFQSLQHVLPCKWCRKNYKKNLKQLPLTMKVMKNRHTFSKWLYDLHEIINDMLHKPTKNRLTYQEVRCRYEHFRARCNLVNKQEELIHYKKNSKTSKASKKSAKQSKENGCTMPLHGVKSKSILYIVPKDMNFKTSASTSIIISPKCNMKPRHQKKSRTRR